MGLLIAGMGQPAIANEDLQHRLDDVQCEHSQQVENVHDENARLQGDLEQVQQEADATQSGLTDESDWV
jgi:hypothetical protein